ncbi:hypothetical protein pb186bvf_006477 [Paramecium bursaria]
MITLRKLFDKFYQKAYAPPPIIYKPQEVVWQVFRRIDEQKQLEYFLSYEKDIYGYSKNSQNIMFIVGPKGAGKSWFIKNICKQSIYFDNKYYDYKNFIQNLKDTLLQQVKQSIHITPEIIQNALLKKYHISYLDFYFKKYVQENNLQLESKPLQIDNQWDSQQLEFWTADAQELAPKLNGVGFKDNFLQLVKEKNDALEISFKIMELMQDSEMKAHQVQLDFIFLLLSYLSGFYDPKFKRSPKGVPLQEISLVILNFDKIFEYYRRDKDAYDFLDHLLLRSITKGVRYRFPIIIESSNCLFFNRNMFEMMHVDFNTYHSIDIDHLHNIEAKTQFGYLFDDGQFDQVFNTIGGDLKEMHNITKQFVTNPDFDLQNYLKLSNFEKDYNKFCYKVNMVKVNHLCASKLDNNQIDDKLRHIFEAVVHHHGEMWTGSFFNDATLMHDEVIEALQMEQILYHPKYESYMMWNTPIYNLFAKQILEDSKYFPVQEKIGFIERLRRKLPWRDDDYKQKGYSSKATTRKFQLFTQEAEEPRIKLQGQLDDDLKPYHTEYVIVDESDDE